MGIIIGSSDSSKVMFFDFCNIFFILEGVWFIVGDGVLDEGLEVVLNKVDCYWVV